VLDFRPPQDSPLLIGLCKAGLPLILKFKMHDAEVKVVGDGLKRFEELRGKRTVVCPNHSYRHDPEVMFTLSKMADEDFNFIAAREVFDWNHGLNGWLLQHLGCYSVVRGAVDRESFKTTKSIISGGKKKLVLFPEGEISRQNDVLLPLETGAAQLSFWALDDLQKTQPNEPVFIMPVALKYTYKRDITDHLEWCMLRIEKRLNINDHTETSLYKRVRRAAGVVLKALERQYNCKVPEDASLNDRMQCVKTQALQTIAEVLDVELPAKGSHLDWVRVLRNTMDDMIYVHENGMSPYEKRVHEEKTVKLKNYYRDLDRVVSFIAIYEGYLTPPATQERVANVVELLEAEVFGEISNKGPRLILVDIGKPINLLDLYAEYKKNKRSVLDKVSLDLTNQLYGMLKSMDEGRKAVYVS
jgi:1-acyl-sn-glycerol-3-phosphate acyltransferase